MDRVRNNKIVLMIISIATLFVAVVAISFAYFTTTNGGTSTTELLIQTSPMDSLVFSSDEQITLDVYENNFGYGDGDIVGIAYSNVELTGNNANTSNLYCYSVKLNILENDFEYTTMEHTPELVLSLYGSDVPFDDDDDSNSVLLVDEMDITTETTEKIELYKAGISAPKGETAHKYFKTLIKLNNLDTVQDENAGKEFVGSIVIDKTVCGER